MNKTIQDLLQRRSVRKFKSDPVPKDLVKQVVEAGLNAASGMNNQGTKILVITNEQWKQKFINANRKIAGMPNEMNPFYGAPVILVVIANKTAPTGIYDGSLVIGNMLLASYSLGLGSCWIHRAKEEFETPEFQQLLKDIDIEGEWQGIGHVALGYPDQKAADIERKPNRVYFVE